MGCLSAKQAQPIKGAAPQMQIPGDSLPATQARRTSRAGVHELKQQYNINKKVLGSGSFGKVFQAENKADNSHQVAIKVIAK